MTTTRTLHTLALTLLLASTGCKQTPTPTDTTTNKAEIQQWLDAWSKDFRTGDVTALMTLYDPNVLAYDIVPPIQYTGKAAYQKDFADSFATYQLPIQLENRDVRITTSGDVAFVTLLQHVSITLKTGQKTDNWFRITAGLHKVDGKWLDLHDHVSLPVDLSTGKAVMDIQP